MVRPLRLKPWKISDELNPVFVNNVFAGDDLVSVSEILVPKFEEEEKWAGKPVIIGSKYPLLYYKDGPGTRCTLKNTDVTEGIITETKFSNWASTTGIKIFSPIKELKTIISDYINIVTETEDTDPEFTEFLKKTGIGLVYSGQIGIPLQKLMVGVPVMEFGGYTDSTLFPKFTTEENKYSGDSVLRIMNTDGFNYMAGDGTIAFPELLDWDKQMMKIYVKSIRKYKIILLTFPEDDFSLYVADYMFNMFEEMEIDCSITTVNPFFFDNGFKNAPFYQDVLDFFGISPEEVTLS